MARVLGIDFGTSFCRMAIIEEGKPVLLQNRQREYVTPSVVAFTRAGECLVGQSARQQAAANFRNTIASIKRLLGRTPEELREVATRVAYKLVEGPNGQPMIEVEANGQTRQFSPIEITAIIFARLKGDAEMHLRESIPNAVITVPASFDDCQRRAVRDAGRIAGFERLRISTEPTVAALAYSFDKENDDRIAICDLGSGCFDVSLIEVGLGIFEVKAIHGDTRLGGDDWDARISHWITDQFSAQLGEDLQKDEGAQQRIRDEAERAKIALSCGQVYEITVPSGPKVASIKLTRAKMEQLCEDLYKRMTVPLQQCLEGTTLTGEQIDKVLLLGGSGRDPRISEIVSSFFIKAFGHPATPSELVALGAAIEGGLIGGQVKNDLLLLDVMPISLGIETTGGVCTKTIERNTTIPTRESKIFSTASDNQTRVELHVLQGESPMAKDNKTIGYFYLTDIRPAPRGIPQIEVTFEIDANGILQVSAKDLDGAKEQKVVSTVGVSESQINEMRKGLEEFVER